MTGIHDVNADQLHRAIAATGRHRDATLVSLTRATVGLVAAQADRYNAYRQGLGRDGEHLPASFHAVVADICAFADPVLEAPVLPTRRWSAAQRRWNPAEP